MTAAAPAWPSSGSARRPHSPPWLGSHRLGAGNGLRFYAAVAVELGPDSAKEHSGRSSLSANQFRWVLDETVEWHEAAVLRPQPASPVRGSGVEGVGDRWTAGARRPHAPTHDASSFWRPKTCTNWEILPTRKCIPGRLPTADLRRHGAASDRIIACSRRSYARRDAVLALGSGNA
jgi:hypothetical protein